jgi:hypothetical protein
MPDLGYRGNVLGPQPIGRRKPVPEGVIAAAERMMELIAAGDRAGLEALATAGAKEEAAAMARHGRPGSYDSKEIVTHARVNDHYYVKARLRGPGVEPVMVQVRFGQQDGRWLIWDAVDLTGRRSGWTK